jgi:hypothetical protein
VRALGDRFDSSYSKIEVLWELANYFKHRDEWDLDTWDGPPTKQIAHTVDVIRAAGLQPSSSGNMRTGAEALGNPDYADLAVFEDVIERWARDVRKITRQAFGR